MKSYAIGCRKCKTAHQLRTRQAVRLQRVLGPCGGLHTVVQWPRWAGVMRRDVVAQSGRVFAAAGQLVWFESSDNYMVWIYDAPKLGNMLCTLRPESLPWLFVAYLEEK